MIRILILALLPCPAQAWEFSPEPICTLTHQTPEAEIAVTYDASLPEYALFITLRSGEWPEATAFQMVFSGGQELAIGTSAHTLSADRATLTVRDSGFGNVLDGIEFNAFLGATLGGKSLVADTFTAAPAVQSFRACPADLPATS